MNSKKIDLEFKIPHRNWLESSNELFALMNAVLPGEVIVVVGPSRAGKSRLIEYMCSLVSRAQEHEEKGLMPCVVVEVANCGQNGTFSTKNLAVRMLEKLKHPLFGIADDLTQEAKRLQLISRTPGASLQLSAEIALRARGTRFLFLDEAQHVSYAKNSERGASAIMNSWKCLARSANVVLIIVGAYPILSVLHDSPHMCIFWPNPITHSDFIRSSILELSDH